MSISPVHRVWLEPLWSPTLDEILSGAYRSIYAQDRRSVLVRLALWLPHLRSGRWRDRISTEYLPPLPEDSRRDKRARRIWPADWPPVIVEIRRLENCRCPEPAPPITGTFIDLFI